MYNHFIKPLSIIIIFCLIPTLGIIADIASLTSINFLTFIQSNSYIIITGIILLYISLVVLSYFRNEPNNDALKLDNKTEQNITTRNVKNSTIIQIKKSKED